MPQKIKQEDGTEVEFFSQAELEEQATARAEEAATKAREEANSEAQTEREKLEAEKADLEAQLAKELAKDKNFKALRESKGGTDPEVLKQIEEVNKRINDLAEKPVKDILNGFKRNNYGEDKDLKTKFDYYFDKLGKEAKTEEEILKAATEAHSLVASGQKPNLDYRMTGTRISNDFQKPQNDGQESEVSKAIGAALGVSEADKKKYAKKTK